MSFQAFPHFWAFILLLRLSQIPAITVHHIFFFSIDSFRLGHRWVVRTTVTLKLVLRPHMVIEMTNCICLTKSCNGIFSTNIIIIHRLCHIAINLDWKVHSHFYSAHKLMFSGKIKIQSYLAVCMYSTLTWKEAPKTPITRTRRRKK